MFSAARLASSLLQAMSKSGPWFYAVKHGRIPGVYKTWSECESQVKGFSKPAFKKFSSQEEAHKFVSDSAEYTKSNTMQMLPKQTSHSTHNGNAEQLAQSSGSGTSGESTEALSFTVTEMQATIGRMLGVMEGLSSDVCRLQDTVTRLESAVFIAPGSKRSFSTSTSQPDRPDEKKRKKADKADSGAFTGPRFSDEDGVHVYTDGGCFGNGQSGARAGIGVYWNLNDPDNVSEPLPGRASNNRAEIHAAVRAVQIAKRKEIKNLIVHTDSQFLINGITKWIKGWKRNGWKLSTGHPVINKDDFTALDDELSGISVKWVYVKGHSGDPANEEADKLAKQGADMSGRS